MSPTPPVGSDDRVRRDRDRPVRILVVGCGDLSVRVLHGLTATSHPRHLALLGRDGEAVVRTANMMSLAATQLGRNCPVDPLVRDLADVSGTAEDIARFAPDVIFSAASRQPWYAISDLPADRFARVSAAHFGPWLPMHLDPALKLMKAVRASGTGAIVVNAAYPDAVHPALAGAGLSPALGIGNVANSVPALRTIAARRLGCAPAEVQPRFVAHHFVSHRISRTGDSGGAAYDLTFWQGGTEVTDRLPVDTAFHSMRTEYRRTGGRQGQLMTAASALGVLEPLLTGSEATVHVPGWHGLPGGYPVRISQEGTTLDLPPQLGERDAVEINRDGQRHDGIARIAEDGLVEFTDESVEIMREELGYTCKQLALADVEEAADELAARYAECGPL
ncbi:hypothetical protein [Streptomyces pacificus]|uniref:Saccharopine dehydrogenase NADP binding domain-containing protein n=1 Tax=Streptomyces pacificus TaxID=2705029 RepID=A0A6A0B3T0_9ACTN|nr:hypothetical protein [Streptomyces pacificus]GFH38974.1 hypothetical protein SCWH03_52380 [Streptomyces pacificus]